MEASSARVHVRPSTDPYQSRLGRRLRNLFRGVAVFLFVFGLYSFDSLSPRWGVVILFLLSLPLALSFTPYVRLMLVSAWLALIIVAQSFLPPDDYVTIRPSHYYFDVPGDLFPGIVGIQEIFVDDHGYRTTKKIDYDSKNGIRIFTLGGSTTFNILLDNRATWNHLLQEMLSEELGWPVEVINAGVSGTRARHHLATLKNIARYEPDLVIVLVGFNDWNLQIKQHFLTREERIAIRRSRIMFSNTRLGAIVEKFLVVPAKAYLAGEPELSTQERNRKREPDLRWLGVARELNNAVLSSRRSPVLAFKPRSVSDDYARTLEGIANECRRQGIPCLFLTQPTGYHRGAEEELKDLFWMTPSYESYTLDFESLMHVALLYNQYLSDFADEQAQPLCDIAPHVEPSTDNFFDDAHFNTSGSLVVAELVLPCALSALNAKG